MNIVFVYHYAISKNIDFQPWRGIMYHDAIKKTGLHQVDLIQSQDLCKNTQQTNYLCSQSQIIIIEGSPDIDLLSVVNYWKSKGKKVLIDIPLTSERICSECQLPAESTFSITQMYNKYQNKDNEIVGQSERFRWGLHLADRILVSSNMQQSNWQLSAPVKVIPEFIDIGNLLENKHYLHNPLVIGIFSSQEVIDPTLDSVKNIISSNFSSSKLLLFQEMEFSSSKNPGIFFDPSLQSNSTNWVGLLSTIDLCVFWDLQPERGKYYRNILETMSMKIPWILNEQKGYQDLSKYGLIIKNHRNWQASIIDKIEHINEQNSILEEGYLHSLGLNIDDHIYEILAFFSEILKNPF